MVPARILMLWSKAQDLLENDGLLWESDLLNLSPIFTQEDNLYNSNSRTIFHLNMWRKMKHHIQRV